MKETGNVKKVLATTFIVLLVVSAVSAALNKNFFTDVYTFVSSPFQQTAASLMSEYGQDASKTDYDDIKKENEILRKYYGIKDDNPDYKIEVAAVIRRDPNDDYYGFTINKGSRNDVKLNDPVITENGLVGWISDVQVTTSRVTTLLSPEAKVGAMDKKSGDSGIATGSASYSDKGMLILSVISADNKIQENDIVITTGVGGVYPPDIVIGKVVNLDNDPYDTTPFAVLKPYEDLRSVSDVVVITSFDGQGVVEAVSSDKKATNDTARLKK